MARAVHMDASKPGQVLRWGLCGFSGDTETDVTKVTCKSCRKRFSTGAGAAKGRARRAKSVDELAQLLAPKAPFPPRMTPSELAVCCRASQGRDVRRCGDCAICVWEREANLWGDVSVSAHNRQLRLAKPEGAPRWPSFKGALRALHEWDLHDRAAQSSSAGILARLQRGAPCDGGASRPDDPMLNAAGEIVLVREACRRAYPEGAHKLSQAERIALLMLRTPGVVDGTKDQRQAQARAVAAPGVEPYEMPTYEALAEATGCTVGDLQALVNNGRYLVAVDLHVRGLIPSPRAGMRRRPADGRRSFTGAEPQGGAT